MPGAVTEKARSLTASQATLHGTVEPAKAEVTSCTFEYHGESSHGSLPCEPGPPYSGSSVQVSAVASGLQRNDLSIQNSRGHLSRYQDRK